MNQASPSVSPPRRQLPPGAAPPTRQSRRESPPPPAEVIPDDPEVGSRKAVYTIIERGAGKPSRWLRVGIAFVNRDGSLNVMLDALPVTGTLHVRDFPPRETEDAGE